MELIIFKHDTYTLGLEKLLNTSILVQPNFAASFVFELRCDQEGNYFVKVLFKDDLYPIEPIKLKPVTVYGLIKIIKEKIFNN